MDVGHLAPLLFNKNMPNHLPQCHFPALNLTLFIFKNLSISILNKLWNWVYSPPASVKNVKDSSPSGWRNASSSVTYDWLLILRCWYLDPDQYPRSQGITNCIYPAMSLLYLVRVFYTLESLGPVWLISLYRTISQPPLLEKIQKSLGSIPSVTCLYSSLDREIGPAHNIPRARVEYNWEKPPSLPCSCNNEETYHLPSQLVILHINFQWFGPLETQDFQYQHLSIFHHLNKSLSLIFDLIFSLIMSHLPYLCPFF